MPAVEAGPDHHVLPADAGIRGGAGSDASGRRALSGPSVCRSSNAAGPIAAGRPCDGAAARRDPNEVLIAKKV